MRNIYRIKVEVQEGSEDWNNGIRAKWLLPVFTSKRSANEFAERLEKTGIKVLEIARR